MEQKIKKRCFNCELKYNNQVIEFFIGDLWKIKNVNCQ